MTKKWTHDQLKSFSKANDMRISPFYPDGKTYGTPTHIWSVVVENNLYSRPYSGTKWYKSAITQKAGKIHLAGKDYKVKFAAANGNPTLNKKINQAYQNKYQGDMAVPTMISAENANHTVRIDPE